MKIIAVIEADTQRSPLGTPSRLAEELAGRCVLKRTVERVLACRRLDGVFVVTPAEQRSTVADLLDGADVPIETHAAGAPPWQELVRCSRKWALDGWRGGIGGTCVFDEHIHCAVLGALAARENADAVASIPAAAAVLDSELLEAMADHARNTASQVLLTFAQTAPGLSILIAQTKLLDELTRAGVPPGRALAFDPNDPKDDPTIRPCCYKVPTVVSHAGGRLLADTHRSVERIASLLEDLGDEPASLRAERVSRWLLERRDQPSPHLPRELELELTTQDELAGTTLRPRGSAVGARGPIELSLIERLACEMARYDDSRIVLGGFGEPLRHPQFAAVVAACRRAGIFGLAVRTNGIGLDGPALEALLDHKVDVVIVTIDAASPEGYRRVHGVDAYEQVCANIARLDEQRRQRGQPQPLIVPEMVKTRTTLREMEAFFDMWMRRAGWANIVGYSDHAGQLEDRAVMNMAPPVRRPCLRIMTRALVLADGRLVPCDQDFAGRHAVGTVQDHSLAELWTGPAMERLRASHRAGRWEGLALCPACKEWHRP